MYLCRPDPGGPGVHTGAADHERAGRPSVFGTGGVVFRTPALGLDRELIFLAPERIAQGRSFTDRFGAPTHGSRRRLRRRADERLGADGLWSSGPARGLRAERE